MTEQIILTIDPAPDGGHCGECKWLIVGSYSDNRDWCDCFSEDMDTLDVIVAGVRTERCLAAARTLREEREAARRVIEAGRALRHEAIYDLNRELHCKAFDAAVAQYEAAREEK